MIDETTSPLPKLRPREPASHKGDYGRAILVGGSTGMAGAVAMAGMACLRSGAGLVTLGVPRCIGPAVASFCPAYMLRELVDDEPGVLYWANVFDLAPLEDQYDAWAIGPGMGSPAKTAELTGRIYFGWRQPLVIDADGLNGLALHLQQYQISEDGLPGPRVLTPHPGEYARLIEDETLAAKAKGSDKERVEAAAALAARDPAGGTVVVLKGHRTVVADTQRFAINSTGNPGMATGGSGDVLTGMITALLAQGCPPFAACRLAVHVHGLAGDLAAERLGQTSMIATDLIDCLPEAFQRVNDQ